MGTGFAVDRGQGGALFKHPMATPNSQVTLVSGLLTGTVGEHYSVHGPDTWALSCRYRKNAEATSVPFDNECFLFNTTTPNTVKRLVHHRANVYGDDYNSQPHGNLSMDGQFIAWTSNWDGASTATRRCLHRKDQRHGRSYPTRRAYKIDNSIMGWVLNKTSTAKQQATSTTIDTSFGTAPAAGDRVFIMIGVFNSGAGLSAQPFQIIKAIAIPSPHLITSPLPLDTAFGLPLPPR